MDNGMDGFDKVMYSLMFGVLFAISFVTLIEVVKIRKSLKPETVPCVDISHWYQEPLIKEEVE